MRIVQLSDVHFGSQFRNDVFEQVIDEVNELSPLDDNKSQPTTLLKVLKHCKIWIQYYGLEMTQSMVFS